MIIKHEEIKDSGMSQYFRSVSLFFSLSESELRGYIYTSMIAILLWAWVYQRILSMDLACIDHPS